jgi:hypothetical protein
LFNLVGDRQHGVVSGRGQASNGRIPEFLVLDIPGTPTRLHHGSERSQHRKIDHFIGAEFRADEVAEMGRQRLKAAIEIQAELFDRWHEINRQWLARVQSEVDIASGLTGELTAPRTVPDAATACQEWAGKRINMFAEDGRRLVTDRQKLMATGTRLFSNGRAAGSAGART